MLDVMKDVIKSKTMVGVLVFIIGVSYISASQNRNLEVRGYNNLSFTEQTN